MADIPPKFGRDADPFLTVHCACLHLWIDRLTGHTALWDVVFSAAHQGRVALDPAQIHRIVGTSVPETSGCLAAPLASLKHGTSPHQETRINYTFQNDNTHVDTAVRNWRQGLVAPCRVVASETNDRPPGSHLEGFDCAVDVIVPLHWAPDCPHMSGLEYVRASLMSASCEQHTSHVTFSHVAQH